jgi:hypothetical protein
VVDNINFLNHVMVTIDVLIKSYGHGEHREKTYCDNGHCIVHQPPPTNFMNSPSQTNLGEAGLVKLAS